jgi:glutathione S-transferase
MAERPILGYWCMRGRAGAARALLTHLEVDFENKIYASPQEWAEAKPNLPLNFPNLPYYIDGDVKMSESMAILRQICRKYAPTYLGRTLKEQAQAD